MQTGSGITQSASVHDDRGGGGVSPQLVGIAEAQCGPVDECLAGVGVRRAEDNGSGRPDGGGTRATRAGNVKGDGTGYGNIHVQVAAAILVHDQLGRSSGGGESGAGGTSDGLIDHADIAAHQNGRCRLGESRCSDGQHAGPEIHHAFGIGGKTQTVNGKRSGKSAAEAAVGILRDVARGSPGGDIVIEVASGADGSESIDRVPGGNDTGEVGRGASRSAVCHPGNDGVASGSRRRHVEVQRDGGDAAGGLIFDEVECRTDRTNKV